MPEVHVHLRRRYIEKKLAYWRAVAAGDATALEAARTQVRDIITGLVVLAVLPQSAPVVLAAVVMILVGGGGGLTVPPIAALIFDSAPGHLAGTAGGVLNTFRQMGGSRGVAVFGAVTTLLSLTLRGVEGVRQ